MIALLCLLLILPIFHYLLSLAIRKTNHIIPFIVMVVLTYYVLKEYTLSSGDSSVGKSLEMLFYLVLFLPFCAAIPLRFLVLKKREKHQNSLDNKEQNKCQEYIYNLAAVLFCSYAVIISYFLFLFFFRTISLAA